MFPSYVNMVVVIVSTSPLVAGTVVSDLGLSQCDLVVVEAQCEETPCSVFHHSQVSAGPAARGLQSVCVNIHHSQSAVTSTCLVVRFEKLQHGVQQIMLDLCQGRKKCVALVTVSQEEDINQDPPPPEELPVQQRFSLQTAWLVVKRLARGYMVRLTCSGRTRVWLLYTSPEVPSEIKRKTNRDLDDQIFQGWWQALC